MDSGPKLTLAAHLAAGDLQQAMQSRGGSTPPSVKQVLTSTCHMELVGSLGQSFWYSALARTDSKGEITSSFFTFIL